MKCPKCGKEMFTKEEGTFNIIGEICIHCNIVQKQLNPVQIPMRLRGICIKGYRKAWYEK